MAPRRRGVVHQVNQLQLTVPAHPLHRRAMETRPQSTLTNQLPVIAVQRQTVIRQQQRVAPLLAATQLQIAVRLQAVVTQQMYQVHQALMNHQQFRSRAMDQPIVTLVHQRVHQAYRSAVARPLQRIMQHRLTPQLYNQVVMIHHRRMLTAVQ